MTIRTPAKPAPVPWAPLHRDLRDSLARQRQAEAILRKAGRSS
jgi:hypothetical protein